MWHAWLACVCCLASASLSPAVQQCPHVCTRVFPGDAAADRPSRWLLTSDAVVLMAASAPCDTEAPLCGPSPLGDEPLWWCVTVIGSCHSGPFPAFECVPLGSGVSARSPPAAVTSATLRAAGDVYTQVLAAGLAADTYTVNGMVVAAPVSASCDRRRVARQARALAMSDPHMLQSSQLVISATGPPLDPVTQRALAVWPEVLLTAVGECASPDPLLSLLVLSPYHVRMSDPVPGTEVVRYNVNVTGVARSVSDWRAAPHDSLPPLSLCLFSFPDLAQQAVGNSDGPGDAYTAPFFQGSRGGAGPYPIYSGFLLLASDASMLGCTPLHDTFTAVKLLDVGADSFGFVGVAMREGASVVASATVTHIGCAPTASKMWVRADGAVMGHVPRSVCTLCPPGLLCDAVGVASPCPAGYHCPTGTLAVTEAVPHLASGSHGPLPCSPGSYCPSGSAVEAPCPAGWHCPSPSLAVPCPAGTYQPVAGLKPRRTPCLPCPLGRHAAHPAALACDPSREFDAVFLLSGGSSDVWPPPGLDHLGAVWFAAAQRIDAIPGDCLSSHIAALEAFLQLGRGAHALIVEEDDVLVVSDPGPVVTRFLEDHGSVGWDVLLLAGPGQGSGHSEASRGQYVRRIHSARRRVAYAVTHVYAPQLLALLQEQEAAPHIGCPWDVVPLVPSSSSVWYALDPPVAFPRAGHASLAAVRTAGSAPSRTVEEETMIAQVAVKAVGVVTALGPGVCTAFSSRGRAFPFPPLADFGEWDLAALRFRPRPSPHGVCWAAGLTSSHAASCLTGRHIVFVGDSTIRYQFLALIHLLHTGDWPAEVSVNTTNHPLHHHSWGSWANFFVGTCAAYQPYLTCDVFREETLERRVDSYENYYYHNTALGVTLSMIGVFQHAAGHLPMGYRVEHPPVTLENFQSLPLHFQGGYATVAQLIGQQFGVVDAVVVNQGLWKVAPLASGGEAAKAELAAFQRVVRDPARGLVWATTFDTLGRDPHLGKRDAAVEAAELGWLVLDRFVIMRSAYAALEAVGGSRADAHTDNAHVKAWVNVAFNEALLGLLCPQLSAGR